MTIDHGKLSSDNGSGLHPHSAIRDHPFVTFVAVGLLCLFLFSLLFIASVPRCQDEFMSSLSATTLALLLGCLYGILGRVLLGVRVTLILAALITLGGGLWLMKLFLPEYMNLGPPGALVAPVLAPCLSSSSLVFFLRVLGLTFPILFGFSTGTLFAISLRRYASM